MGIRILEWRHVDLGGRLQEHALGVNNSSLVVGFKSVAPSSPGWQLTSANAINDYDEIAGAGIHNGRREALVLLPQTHRIDSCSVITRIP